MVVIATLYKDPYTYCIYRENGQQVTFKVVNKKIVKKSAKLLPVEIVFIYKNYINESENKIKTRHHTHSK